MGLGGMIAGAAVDAAAKKIEFTSKLKGRTPDQQKVIKYFFQNGGGCFKKPITDSEYDEMVMAKAKSVDYKQKALDKIGLDESQVSEITPIHFEQYLYNDKSYDLRGKDGKWRSSQYQITWLFFSSSQVYVYQNTFNMDEDGKKEQTEEYFYKDITNFSTTSDTVEKIVPLKTSCKGDVTWGKANYEVSRFQLSAMGDKFYASVTADDYVEKSIQGMKAKLREKKG